MRVEGITFPGKRCAYDPRMNPSGHLHEDDIREIVARTRPEILGPVHCAELERFREFVPHGTRLVLPQNGRSIWL